jgi:hypothetical protein
MSNKKIITWEGLQNLCRKKVADHYTFDVERDVCDLSLQGTYCRTQEACPFWASLPDAPEMERLENSVIDELFEYDQLNAKYNAATSQLKAAQSCCVNYLQDYDPQWCAAAMSGEDFARKLLEILSQKECE